MSMEELLARFEQPDHDPLALWAALIDHLRPRQAMHAASAEAALQALILQLSRHPGQRSALSASLARLFNERKQVSLYVSSGLLPSTGFFSETSRRIYGRLLPEVIDTLYLKDLLSVLFHRRDDDVWIAALPDALWLEFLDLVLGPALPQVEHEACELPHGIIEILEALRVLSYHVSAIGLDPELVRIDPDLEEHESPFLAQNAELLSYIEHYKRWWCSPGELAQDEKHLTVMLGQCWEVLQRVRKRATRIGTSLTLTFKLERLRQHLLRIEELLALLDGLRTRRVVHDVAPQLVRLFKSLVRAECRKNHLFDYWGQNVELLSLRMTESASRTGEHYITSNRSEYFRMLRSAALGGFVIALMSGLKILIAAQGLAPLNEALGFCLNYGIGFALIHILGGTVATKQPAMTANAIAASIGEVSNKPGAVPGRNLEALADLIARTVRSQLAAILGNVGVAIPVAIGVSFAIEAASGRHYIDATKALSLLQEIDPRGGALFFAAIAGVCLFLSGLISGYYDNLSAYNRIPQRLLQLRWPQRVLGAARMQRIANYVENNLGALAGNFFFGFLLGGTTALGVLFGLPLDIRHIAFSSAYVGYSVSALDFGLSWPALSLALGGVLLIGLVNLTVSFSLTLSVAMRARRITFAQGRSLLYLLLKRFFSRPQDFLLPPLGSGGRPEPPHAASTPSGDTPAILVPRPPADTPTGPAQTLGSRPPNG